MIALFKNLKKDTFLVSQDEIKKIRSVDWETCAKWWRTLNTWEWPEELLPEESPNKHEHGRRSALMAVIKNKVGEKYLLMHLNVVEDKRMDYECFEDWWDYTFNHDKEAEERFRKNPNKKSLLDT